MSAPGVSSDESAGGLHGSRRQETGPARHTGPPVRDGSRVVVVFIALIAAVALGMIALRLQAGGHANMGADVTEEMPAGSH